jgi:hypothetical protein
MSKALTRQNKKLQADVDPGAQHLVNLKRGGYFPSYFSNFGNFSRLLMRSQQVPFTSGRRAEKQESPLITAFMAIV